MEGTPCKINNPKNNIEKFNFWEDCLPPQYYCKPTPDSKMHQTSELNRSRTKLFENDNEINVTLINVNELVLKQIRKDKEQSIIGGNF